MTEGYYRWWNEGRVCCNYTGAVFVATCCFSALYNLPVETDISTCSSVWLPDASDLTPGMDLEGDLVTLLNLIEGAGVVEM
jgi:hypothetical protein